MPDMTACFASSSAQEADVAAAVGVQRAVLSRTMRIPASSSADLIRASDLTEGCVRAYTSKSCIDTMLARPSTMP
jgi:hypothetical protein